MKKAIGMGAVAAVAVAIFAAAADPKPAFGPAPDSRVPVGGEVLREAHSPRAGPGGRYAYLRTIPSVHNPTPDPIPPAGPRP